MKPINLGTTRVHEALGGGKTRIRQAPTINSVVLAMDPDTAQTVLQWMLDHRDDHRDSAGLLNSTALAEAAASEFDLYGQFGAGVNDFSDDLFELAGAVALAEETTR